VQQLIDYLDHDGLLERKVTVDELFAANTINMYKT
jgi:hypothetical protein